MLDEIDKVGSDWRGDPSSALLEVLDPAQNHTFLDNYLGVPFDLSQVLFIATANTTDTIPAPLLDRMEVIPLSGYTDEEKVQIAQKYLVPKQVAAHGLQPEELTITDDALRRVIRDYTREAGVRNLERQVATIARKVARDIVEGKTGNVEVTPENVVDYLGRPRFFDEVAERTDRPGVATGLAWTPTGGDVLFVEATMMPSERGAADPDRDARRRDARERPGGAVVRPLQRGGARHRPGRLRRARRSTSTSRPERCRRTVRRPA